MVMLSHQAQVELVAEHTAHQARYEDVMQERDVLVLKSLKLLLQAKYDTSSPSVKLETSKGLKSAMDTINEIISATTDTGN